MNTTTHFHLLNHIRSIQIFFLFFLFVPMAFGQPHHPVKNHIKTIPQDEKWISIFNGTNLDGWTPKVTGYKAGENPLDGFRVEDSMIRVDYSKFSRFNGRFGHLFYKDKFSSYILHVEYRFVGELLPDAPSYCYRNSGVMIHSQSAESMDITQNWPVSLECQILGCTSKLKQTTANVCTPGTTVYYKGVLTNEHCIEAASKYYYDGEWVSMDIIVHGGKSIVHVVNGDTVLRYTHPQLGGMLLPDDYPVPSGTLLEDGYLALQAEGQSIDFRKVKLKILHENNYVKKTVKSVSKNPTKRPTTTDKQKTNRKAAVVASRTIDNFDSYSTDEELATKWLYPGYGGRMHQSLETVIKGAGKYSLKCEYTTEKSTNNFYSPVVCRSKWNLSGCNGIQFWFKPDGSGREMTFELNTADKDGKDIHDLWGYLYKTEKGDTSSRIVTIPFFNLIHNTKLSDAPNENNVFKPDIILQVSFYINGRNDDAGSGVYYFDEIKGAKLQF